MPNRLAQETSPYLLQHKNNPVDWLPWGDEAFEMAKQEDKPIFLSVGYSSCHWCHVMAHESFEDDEVASLLNRNFVSIKVDREERPDVDEAYMTAVQLQSGRGGWPMSVFLTPDGAPFFAGTYFPKTDRGGHPGFVSILAQLDRMWRTRRAEVADAAEEFRYSLEQAIERPAPSAFRSLDWEFVQEAFNRLAADFDDVNGGFGSAPKFPPHSGIELCLKVSGLEELPRGLRDRARHIALFTLEKMCLGGLQDHVGGGFHRYSTDEHWLLPHFEKMLYDNALMLRNLALAVPLASGPTLGLFDRAAQGIVRWMREEMVSDDGLLCSAIDADSEGEEGKYYVWESAEVRELLGLRAEAFLERYCFQGEGNFLDEATRRRTGANIPHLFTADGEVFEKELEILRQTRAKRIPPLRDAKALVGWNGLAIAGLVVRGERGFAEQLISALERYWSAGDDLPHQVAQGAGSGLAFLEDVAGLAFGLVELDKGKAEPLFGLAAGFRSEEAGDYFATTPAHEKLFGRSKPVFDQPIPSGNALMARALLRGGRTKEAREVIEANLGWIERAPGSTEALLLAAVELLEREGQQPKSLTPPVELKPGQAVSAKLEPVEMKSGKDGWAQAQLKLTVREGFHLNTHEPPARWLKPTEVRIEGLESEVIYPSGDEDRYAGTVDIPIRLRGRGEFELTVTAQPCTETECLQPVEIRLGGRVY